MASETMTTLTTEAKKWRSAYNAKVAQRVSEGRDPAQSHSVRALRHNAIEATRARELLMLSEFASEAWTRIMGTNGGGK